MPGGGQLDQVGDEEVGRDEEVQEEAGDDVGAAIVVAGEAYQDAILVALVWQGRRGIESVPFAGLRSSIAGWTRLLLLAIYEYHGWQGMRTQHQNHEVPEAHEAGALVCIVAQA